MTICFLIIFEESIIYFKRAREKNAKPSGVFDIELKMGCCVTIELKMMELV